MVFQATVQQMIMLFLIVAIGFTARKLRVLNQESDRMLSSLVLTITLPCTIIASVVTRETLPSPATIGMVLAVSCLSFAVVMVVAFVIPPLLGIKGSTRGAYSFMLMFGNTAFLGYPVLEAIFGPETVLYGAIFNIPFNILVFTVGVMMLSQAEGSLKERALKGSKNLRSTSLAACFIAMILALFNITDIGILEGTVETLGVMTTPAALLIIGSNLATVSFRSTLTSWRIYVMTALRLIGIPLITLAVFGLFIDDSLLLGILAVINGMPVATNGTMLCLNYGGDIDTIIRGTFITTLLSIITIPLVALLVI